MARLARSEKSFLDHEFGQRSLSDLARSLPSELFRKTRTPQAVEFDYKKALQGVVFVIMPFAEETGNTFAAVEEECEKLDPIPFRADRVFGSGMSLRHILALIEMAEFIICDLTGARANVLYELGYAHGVGNHGNNVVLIAANDTKLPFDVSPLNVNYYSSPDQLRRILNLNLASMRNRSS